MASWSFFLDWILIKPHTLTRSLLVSSSKWLLYLTNACVNIHFQTFPEPRLGTWWLERSICQTTYEEGYLSTCPSPSPHLLWSLGTRCPHASDHREAQYPDRQTTWLQGDEVLWAPVNYNPPGLSFTCNASTTNCHLFQKLQMAPNILKSP